MDNVDKMRFQFSKSIQENQRLKIPCFSMCDVSYHTFGNKSIHVLKFNKICILCNLRPHFYTRVLKTQNINVFLPISPSWYFYTLTPKSQFHHIHPNLIPIHLSNPFQIPYISYLFTISHNSTLTLQNLPKSLQIIPTHPYTFHFPLLISFIFPTFSHLQKMHIYINIYLSIDLL